LLPGINTYESLSFSLVIATHPVIPLGPIDDHLSPSHSLPLSPLSFVFHISKREQKISIDRPLKQLDSSPPSNMSHRAKARPPIELNFMEGQVDEGEE
jgi:hypothetical protein